LPLVPRLVFALGTLGRSGRASCLRKPNPDRQRLLGFLEGRQCGWAGIFQYGGRPHGRQRRQHPGCRPDGGHGLALQHHPASLEPGLLVRLRGRQPIQLPRLHLRHRELLLGPGRLRHSGPALVRNLLHRFGALRIRLGECLQHQAAAHGRRQRRHLLGFGGRRLQEQPRGFIRPLQRALRFGL
jgi:hypothetical protein